MKDVLIFSFLFILLTGCDTSEPIESNDALLPKKIKTEQSYNGEPLYDYTHITTFEYDGYNRPVNILREYYRRLKTETADKNILQHIISTKLQYSLIEDFVTQTDIIKSRISDGYDTHTETRVYNITSGGDNKIEITLDGKFKETIDLSKGLAVKYNRVVYSDIPEEKIFNYTEEYKYNSEGDISEYIHTQEEYSRTEKYSYDGYNGVYKHMNIPQWLFIALLGSEGRIHNIKEISTLHNNKFTLYGNNINKYNSSGYVKEREFRPNSQLDGASSSKTTYEYIDAIIYKLD